MNYYRLLFFVFALWQGVADEDDLLDDSALNGEWGGHASAAAGSGAAGAASRAGGRGEGIGARRDTPAPDGGMHDMHTVSSTLLW